jgi:hypothetical protein
MRRMETMVACLLFALATSAVASTWQQLQTPALETSPVRLRTVHAINPRFPRLSRAGIVKILATAQDVVREHFAIELQFDVPLTTPLADLMERVPDAPRTWLRRERFRGWNNEEDVRALAEAFYSSLHNSGHSLAGLKSYADPYLDYGQDAPDLWGFTLVLLAHEQEREAAWQRRDLHDDQPIMHSDGLPEWDRWAVLGYSELDYEVVITNQLVVGTSKHASSMHSAIRGSVTTGTTFYNRNSPTDAYAFLSTAPFQNYFAEVRNDGVYAEDLKFKIAGAYLAHELGHLLLRLGHPYAHPACVMRPAPMFNFRAWYEQLDAKRCFAAKAKAMLPGAVPLYKNADW